jgi:hypothetical protein
MGPRGAKSGADFSRFGWDADHPNPGGGRDAQRACRHPGIVPVVVVVAGALGIAMVADISCTMGIVTQTLR